MGRLVRINPATEEKNSQAAVVATGAHGRLVRTGDVQRTSPVGNTVKLPSRETERADELDKRTTPSASRQGQNRSFGERLAKAAGSGLVAEGANLANLGGVAADRRGGTEMSAVYRRQVETLDKQIAALEKTLKDPTMTAQDIRETNEALAIARSEREKYGKVIESGEKTALGLYDTADKGYSLAEKWGEESTAGTKGIEKGALKIVPAATQIGLQVAERAIAPGFDVAGRALSAAGANAADYRHKAGEQYDKEKAALRATVSALGVAAGGALSKGVNAAGLKLLRAAGKQNHILPNVLLGGANAVGYAAGETGASELSKAMTEEDYTPDWNAIGQTAMTAFAFGAITSAINAAAMTGRNKRYMNELNDAVKERYDYAKRIIEDPRATAGQKAAGAESVMNAADKMRGALDELQVVGAQKEVDAMREFLLSIYGEMMPYTGAGSAGAGTAGITPMTPGGGSMTVRPGEGANPMQEAVPPAPITPRAAGAAAAQQNTMPAQPAAAQEGAQGVGEGNLTPVPQNAAQGAQEAKADALDAGGRVPLDQYATPENAQRVSREINDGTLAVDSHNKIYRVDAGEHIDRRDSASVGERSVNAFQFDHPELHQYFAEAAADLSEEMSFAQRGGELVRRTSHGAGDDEYIRTKRGVSERIARLLDDEGVRYDDIDRSIEAIIHNHGQENFAAAKRVELLLDEMLTNGYTDIHGRYVAPNERYIEAKRAIPGADTSARTREELPLWDMAEGQNGGIYGRQEENAGGAEFAEAGGQRADAVAAEGDLYRGDGQRGAAEPGAGGAGQLRKGAKGEEYRKVVAQRRKAAVLEPVTSAQELGVPGGTESQTLHVLPEEAWDDELREFAAWARERGVQRVTMVTGLLQVNTEHGAVGVRGTINRSSGEMVLRVDPDGRASASEIGKHEIGHLITEEADVRAFMEEVKRGGNWRGIYEVYERCYEPLTGGYVGMTEAERELYVWEEIMEDAYAGLDSYGQRASRYHEQAVKLLERAPEAPVQAVSEPENVRLRAVDEPKGRGPPEKFSYAGRDAGNADLEALHEAERYEMQGVDAETIRQKTGWFRGADGKWRWEIDDSGMKLRFESGLYDYDTELREKTHAWDRLTNRELTDEQRRDLADYQRSTERGEADEALYEKLTGEFGGDFEKWALTLETMKEAAKSIPNYTTLGELVDAPALFATYPDMKDMSVTFHNLERGQLGGYHRTFDSIELSRELKQKPEALLNSLIHEVQHAIQQREGFTPGANLKYWNRKLEEGYDGRDAETRREGARLRKQYEQMGANDPEFMRSMEELNAMAPTVPRGKIDLETWEQVEPDPPEWVRFDERRDQLEEKYGDRVWDYFSLRDSIDRNARDGRLPGDLYRDTAGEIEARDAAARRGLTAEERRGRKPDTGDENTVFADGGDGYAMSRSEQDSVKEQLREHQGELNNMKAVATIRDNGWKGMSTGAFRQKIVNDLKKTGYRVDNPSIGLIDFDEKLLNRSLNYIQTDAEAAAYQALPQVLKRGIEISGHGNHKGRDYETLTIAAPVELNGKRGNMAVVVMKTKGNRYKVHRILTPEGEAFALPEMTNAEPNTVGTVTSGSQSLGGSAPAISSASGDSISRNGKNVKYSAFNEEVARQLAGEDRGKVKFSAEDEGDGRYLADLDDRSIEERKKSISLDEAINELYRQKGLSYRFYSSDDPMSRAGYAMFADEPDRAGSGYGGDEKRAFSVEESSLTDISDIKEKIIEARHNTDENTPWELEDYEDVSDDSFAELFDPEDIVDSAAAYDDESLVSWLWNNVLEPNDIAGIKTSDGAVAFSSDIIKRNLAAEIAFGRSNGDDVRFSAEDTTDSAGRELTVQQQEYFKDSKVRDEDGRLKVMYHGTNADKPFTVFDTYGGKFGLFGRGSYFTDDPEVAHSYTAKGKGKAPRTYEVYLDIKNPLDMDAAFDRSAWTDQPTDIRDAIAGATTNEDVFRALKQYCEDEGMIRWEAEDFISDTVRSAGFDGITHVGGGRYGSKDGQKHRVFIAFDPEQIKRVDNKTPTDDPDIRFSAEDEGDEWSRELERMPESVQEAVRRVKGSRGGSMREFPNLDAYLSDKGARLAEEKAERLRNRGKDEFGGTKALEKLGVKIENSAGDYSVVDQLIANDRAAKTIQRETRKAIKRLGATPKEQNFARNIASGLYDEEDIPTTMNRGKVMQLADYYSAEKSMSTDLIKERRREISERLQEKMEDLFDEHFEGEFTAGKRGKGIAPESGLALYHRTPQRSMRAIFGWNRGQQINEAIFEPVYVNEQERKRFVNRMHDEVRTFKGADGEDAALTQRERALAQLMIEGKAVEEMVGKSEIKQQIIHAAENLLDGAEMTDAAREFGLHGKEERELAQRYADWLETKRELDSGSVDKARVENAAKKYSGLYDEFYAAINDFLVAHGYEPIGFIKGYAPHFQPEAESGKLESALKAIGVDLGAEVGKLPASIAGLTKEFKPNKRYNPFFQHRKGTSTDYDIQKGFEKYIDYLSDVLYHTDDVMRVRAAAKYFRRKYAPDDISALIEQAEDLKFATPEEKELFLKTNGIVDDDVKLSYQAMNRAMEQYTEGLFNDVTQTTKYGDLVTWLDDYGNKLAGKQLFNDRSMEREVGRTSLNVGRKLVSTFARANVAGNLSSSLNQTAQLPLIAGELGPKYVAEAIGDIASGKVKGDFADRSDFLTEKRGIRYLTSTKGDKITEVLFWPLERMDYLMSTIAVRGRYRKELAEGKSEKEAMRAADRWGRDVMGSRSKGTAPLTFQSKNLISQMVNLFQVEALNSWEHVSQDIFGPGLREMEAKLGKKEASRRLAGIIVGTLLGAFLLNRVDEELYGGTPAQFDVLGLLAGFLASGNGLTTNEQLGVWFDDVWQKMTGERLFGTDEDAGNDKFNVAAAAEDTLYNISNDVPYVRNVSGLLGVGDQTLPMPDLYGTAKGIGGAFADAAEGDMLSFSEEIARQLMGLAGDTLPGGRQAEKTAQGIEAVARGGSYKGSGDSKRLQYPVESPLEDPWTALRAAIFGKNAIPESRTYWAAGGKALSAAQTRLYEDLVDSGLSRKQAYEILKRFNDATADLEADRDKNGNPIGGSKKEKIVKEISKLPLSRKQKNMLYLSRGYSEKDLNSLPWN